MSEKTRIPETGGTGSELRQKRDAAGFFPREEENAFPAAAYRAAASLFFSAAKLSFMSSGGNKIRPLVGAKTKRRTIARR